MKRTLICLLALSLIASLFGCAKDGANRENGSGAPSTIDERIAAEEQVIEEMSMQGKMESWRGRGDQGRVVLPGSYDTFFINSLADLAPFRAYFPELSETDAARITSDEGGTVVVLEVYSADTNRIYSVDEVTKEGNRITFLVFSTQAEVQNNRDENGEVLDPELEAPGSPHEYFLFYISSENYNNEELYFSFID